MKKGKVTVAITIAIACFVLAMVMSMQFKVVKETDITYPNPENTPKYREVFEIYKKIHDALAPIYSER